MTEASEVIAQSYAFTGPALDLGTVVINGDAHSADKVRIPLAMMNRHGLIAGATGTGKTKTLQLIAEQLSLAGVPVILADVKGDLSGLSRPGTTNPIIQSRAVDTGDTWESQKYPTEFFSLGNDGIGIPVRAKITSFGPLLLSKVLGLNDTQESSLSLIFRWADSKGLELIDLKDLRAVITHLVNDEGKEDLKNVGGVSKQTANVILRNVSNLESIGGDSFFGEPDIHFDDLMRVQDNKGVISLFELREQAARPELFSTFLMWVLADLFAHLPEIGDADRPKLVFIFDEAHTLFKDASKAFISEIEQTVKLIRSKGVGIFFCSQLPTDIPNAILSQLGARIQHAIRAFTPDDQKALTKTVKTYPVSKVYDLSQSLTSLGTGEAMITVLSEKGSPTAVAWTRLRAPRSFMGDIGKKDVTTAAQASPLWSRYATAVDNYSAYEKLTTPQQATEAIEDDFAAKSVPKTASIEKSTSGGGIFATIASSPLVQSFIKNAGNAIGKEITRSIFGVGKRR